MRLKDVSIGVQLKLGLGLILLFVVALGAVAWYQADGLWAGTEDLFSHPLATRRAISEIRVDIITMDRESRDVLQGESDQALEETIESISVLEADVNRQFDTLDVSYLGPQSDLEDARTEFVQWSAVVAETMRLAQAGQTTAATSRIKTNGVSDVQLKKVSASALKVSDFALAKGNQLFADARTLRDSLRAQLLSLVGLILLLALGVSYSLLRSIRSPLEELTAVTDQYRRGNLSARSGYISTNEFGTLAASLNDLVETIQTEMEVNKRTARLAEVMLGQEELHSFCRELLRALLHHTGSQVGAVYLLNGQRTDFEHFESIGLSSVARMSFSATGREGEFGLALASRQTEHVTDIPADTHFALTTVSGDIRPREMITIPIIKGADVVAMVSLASVRSYPAAVVRSVQEIWIVLTARMNGVLAAEQMRAFAYKLEEQNQELEAQGRKLSRQTDELIEQNTELDQQKRQLDESNRLKSSFLSNMSHELRTPLNSVIALAGVLSRRLHGAVPDEEYSYLEVIERNGQNLLSLINDILDLSRIEAGREQITFSTFSLRDLVAEIVAMIEPQAREKDIVLLNSVGSDLQAISSDVSKCRHILQNIVGNAVKFTEVGTVEISAVQVDQVIQIVVTDTGICIAPDQIPHIFDEFRQADDSTSRMYGGTGLGLSIASKYAAMLHGSIAVESTHGEGSTFTVTLPLTMDVPTNDVWSATQAAHPKRIGVLEQPPAAAGQAAEDQAAGQGRSILLVEDSDPAIIQVTDFLVCEGYQVRVARSGTQALEQIEQALPDAVILDLMMPEVDGFEILRRIRGNEASAHIPVLVLTAKHVTPEELAFLEVNHIQQVIQKGNINKPQLLAAIDEMMPAEVELQTPRSPTPAPPRTSGRLVILVVEDNPDSMTAVKALLRDTGEVIEATDGRQGVDQARTHRPDLILMDLSMPVMDGFQAFEAIRNDEALRHVPVIALTASAMKGSREDILAHGFDAYIAKPIDEKELGSTLREVLDGK